MKLPALLTVSLATLTACTDYQGLTASCFGNENASPAVTRSANSLSLLPQHGGRVSTSTAPVIECDFIPLGAPESR